MSVRGSVAWSLLGNWASFASTLIASIVLARLLTPEQFGVFAVAMATIGIFQAILQVGTGNLLIRASDLDDTMIGSAVSVALLEGLAISFAVAIAAAFADNWQYSPEVGDILLWLILVPPFAAIENVLVAIWWRNLRFDRSAKLLTAKSVMQAVVAIVCAMIGFGAVSLAVGALVSGALGLVTAIYGLRKRRIRPNLVHLRTFATFGGKWMVLGGLRAVNARAPELLLGRLAGLAATGLFNRASSSLDMVVRNGVEPIARVMLPVLGESHRRGTGLADGIIKLSSNITTIFWPLLGFIALEAQPIVLILFGPDWMGAAPVLALLCAGVAIGLPTSGTGESLLILDRLGLSVKIETVRTIVGIALIVIAAPSGLEMVAAARILEAFLFVPVYLVILKQLTHVKLRIWAVAHAKSLLITAATLGPIVALRSTMHPSSSPFLSIAMEAALAAVAFLAAVFALRHPLIAEVRMLYHDRLRPPAADRPPAIGHEA